MLSPDDKIVENITLKLNEANKITLAKVFWPNSRQLVKTYESMVVYLTKGKKVVRFPNDRYFYAGGESAYVRASEPEIGPSWCYNF